MKTAIVIGATGLVGSALVEELSKGDVFDQIIILSRKATECTSANIVNHVIDFERLQNHEALFKGEALFSCLGTTLKQAGSVEAQRKVDLDYQLLAAQFASRNQVGHYLLVSSSGANATSRSAYLKMKGELEDKTKLLPFKHVSIFQPSLLLGDRKEHRRGEGIASVIMPALCALPGLKKYRPITGKEVAQRMIEAYEDQSKNLETYTLDQVFPTNNYRLHVPDAT